MNFKIAETNKVLHDYTELVQWYDSFAVSYLSYESGVFRSPEIIVNGIVPPEDIRIADTSSVKGGFINNRQKYNDRLLKMVQDLLEVCGDTSLKVHDAVHFLERVGKLKKVATHDDSSGLLHSYLLNGEFVTFDSNVLKLNF